MGLRDFIYSCIKSGHLLGDVGLRDFIYSCIKSGQLYIGGRGSQRLNILIMKSGQLLGDVGLRDLVYSL